MNLRTTPATALLLSVALAAPACKTPAEEEFDTIEDVTSEIVDFCDHLLAFNTLTVTDSTWRVESPNQHCQCTKAGDTLECAYIVPLEGESPSDFFSTGKSSQHIKIELRPESVRYSRRSDAEAKVESGLAAISSGPSGKECIGEDFERLGTVTDCKSLIQSLRGKLSRLWQRGKGK